MLENKIHIGTQYNVPSLKNKELIDIKCKKKK